MSLRNSLKPGDICPDWCNSFTGGNAITENNMEQMSLCLSNNRGEGERVIGGENNHLLIFFCPMGEDSKELDIAELHNIDNNLQKFKELDCGVVAITDVNILTLKKWMKDPELIRPLGFPIIFDNNNKAISKNFHILDEQSGMILRAVFIISSYKEECLECARIRYIAKYPDFVKIPIDLILKIVEEVSTNTMNKPDDTIKPDNPNEPKKPVSLPSPAPSPAHIKYASTKYVIVELQFSGHALPYGTNMVGLKVDPCPYLVISIRGNKENFLSKTVVKLTEHEQCTFNIVWKKFKLMLPHNADLLFDVYHWKGTIKSTLLGSFEANLRTLSEGKGHQNNYILRNNGKDAGFVDLEYYKEENTNSITAKLMFRAEDFLNDSYGGLGTCDSYLATSFMFNKNLEQQFLNETEVQRKTTDPTWEPFYITVPDMETKILFEIYNWNSHYNDNLILSFDASLQELSKMSLDASLQDVSNLSLDASLQELSKMSFDASLQELSNLSLDASLQDVSNTKKIIMHNSDKGTVILLSYEIVEKDNLQVL